MADFLANDGLRLYYEDTGQGVPVLCLAGLTRNSRDFDFLAPHLSDCRMIALDARGRGKSQYDPTYANYNVMREAQDVADLLDHLGLDDTFVIGTSRGGLLAMILASGHRSRLRGAVLNDVGPEVDMAGLNRIVAYVGQPPQQNTLAEAAAFLESAMGPAFPGVSKERWLRIAAANYCETADGLELLYDPMIRQAMLEQMEAGPIGDLWPLFDAMQGLPLGVLRGANSDILTQATLDRMHARNPDMLSAVIPDRAHVPFLDEPNSLDLILRVLESK